MAAIKLADLGSSLIGGMYFSHINVVMVTRHLICRSMVQLLGSKNQEEGMISHQQSRKVASSFPLSAGKNVVIIPRYETVVHVMYICIGPIYQESTFL